MIIIIEVNLGFSHVYHFTVFFGQNQSSYILSMYITSEHITKPTNVATRFCSTVGSPM